jgi:hypothetical protein
VIGADTWLLELATTELLDSATSELLDSTTSELLEGCEGRLLELGIPEPELSLELEFTFCCPPDAGGTGSFESDEQFAKTKKIDIKTRNETRYVNPFLFF